MKLLLDAHISARRVATALRSLGHDVRAAGEERDLDGWADEQLLHLATLEDRILVTFNARDFVRIARQWAAAGRSHTGCAVLVGIDHREIGLIIRRIDEVFVFQPDPDRWRDYVAFVSRST